MSIVHTIYKLVLIGALMSWAVWMKIIPALLNVSTFSISAQPHNLTALAWIAKQLSGGCLRWPGSTCILSPISPFSSLHFKWGCCLRRNMETNLGKEKTHIALIFCWEHRLMFLVFNWRAVEHKSFFSSCSIQNCLVATIAAKSHLSLWKRNIVVYMSLSSITMMWCVCVRVCLS